jgi:simple sugar transport system permease protein
VPPEATLVVKAAVVLVVSVIQSASARTVIMRQLGRAFPHVAKKPLAEAAK